jgi:hypothetical protein
MIGWPMARMNRVTFHSLGKKIWRGHVEGISIPRKWFLSSLILGQNSEPGRKTRPLRGEAG